jgi:hypothetical protein
VKLLGSDRERAGLDNADKGFHGSQAIHRRFP